VKKHRSLFALPLLLSAAAFAACGDDGGATDTSTAAGTTIADRTEWCAVAADVDARFEATDTSHDPFRVKQASYAEINSLLTRLTESVELVDAEARGEVAAGLAFASGLTFAVVSAPDEASASAAVDAIYDEIPPDATNGLPGAGWLRDNCGVDVDS
jgi:hypothetical protein